MRQGFVFTFAHDSEIGPFRSGCCELIQIHRHIELIADTFAQPFRQFDTFIHSHVANWNKRADIGGASAWMSTGLLAHVYQLVAHRNQLERAFQHRFRFTGEGDYSPVGIRAGIDIEKGAAIYRGSRAGALIDNVLVASLGNVGHALDYLGHDFSRCFMLDRLMMTSPKVQRE
ncbi:hypothetical protein BMS3Bbin04_01499 [bacterium BMS3Bbin04]|nr:hypothetical protein BMS3Bbin04_01499 [bacterium BMS3Bbin04]